MTPGAGVQIGEESIEHLRLLADIPIAFTVDRILEVTVANGGLVGLPLVERAVDVPWIKDYDAIDGEGPTRWATQFDVSRWGLLTARDDGTLVGGAVVAFATANVHMLEERSDLAALWDIRVRPDARASGIGTQLFRAVESWARDHGARWLKVETQNVNVPACRFYARMGCTLRSIDRFAYPSLPDEAQLIWWTGALIVGTTVR